MITLYTLFLSLYMENSAYFLHYQVKKEKLMLKRQMLTAESVLTVEGFYSLFHMILKDRVSGGELHDFYEVVYVESGFYYVILDGKLHTVPPGSCVFFSPNTYHSGDGSTPVNATIKIISFECNSTLMSHFDNRVFALEGEQRQSFLCAFDALDHCIENAKRCSLQIKEGAGPADIQYARLQFESFLLMLYKNSAPLPKESDRATARKAEFRRISDYLKSNLHRPLTLDDISTECSLSISKLKSICRFFCDCGPIDYLISLRIIRAKYLILEGELNFTEIAQATGFASPHYFSRVFRDRTGMTASQYAKSPNQNII